MSECEVDKRSHLARPGERQMLDLHPAKVSDSQEYNILAEVANIGSEGERLNLSSRHQPDDQSEDDDLINSHLSNTESQINTEIKGHEMWI